MLIEFTITDTNITVITYNCDGSVRRTDTWLTEFEGVFFGPPPPIPIRYYGYRFDTRTDTYDVAEITGRFGDELQLSNISIAKYSKCQTTFYDNRDYTPPPPAP